MLAVDRLPLLDTMGKCPQVVRKPSFCHLWQKACVPGIPLDSGGPSLHREPFRPVTAGTTRTAKRRLSASWEPWVSLGSWIPGVAEALLLAA